MPDPEIPSRSSPSTPATEAKPAVPEEIVLPAVPRRTFALGQIVITSNARAILPPDDVSAAIIRHSRCDWGEVCAEDGEVNERGVRDLGMILSAYRSTTGVKFWVITDPGHEVTTVLLPEDY